MLKGGQPPSSSFYSEFQGNWSAERKHEYYGSMGFVKFISDVHSEKNQLGDGRPRAVEVENGHAERDSVSRGVENGLGETEADGVSRVLEMEKDTSDELVGGRNVVDHFPGSSALPRVGAQKQEVVSEEEAVAMDLDGSRSEMEWHGVRLKNIKPGPNDIDLRGSSRRSGGSSPKLNVGSISSEVAAKESGSLGKRMRDGEDLDSCGDLTADRAFNDHLGLPARKKVYVCEILNTGIGNNSCKKYAVGGLSGSGQAEDKIGLVEGAALDENGRMTTSEKLAGLFLSENEQGGGKLLERLSKGGNSKMRSEANGVHQGRGDATGAPDPDPSHVTKGIGSERVQTQGAHQDDKRREHKGATEEAEPRRPQPVAHNSVVGEALNRGMEASKSNSHREAAASSFRSFQHIGRNRRDPTKDIPRETVVIIEDDSDDERVKMNDVDSDGSSTRGTKPIFQGRRPPGGMGFRTTATSESTSASYSPDEESDSDECKVLDSWPSNDKNDYYSRKRAEVNPVDMVDIGAESSSDDSASQDSDSDSSDLEILGASQGDIRRSWEEAALRRRMGRTMRSAASKANGEVGDPTPDAYSEKREDPQGLAESVATSTDNVNFNVGLNFEIREVISGKQAVIGVQQEDFMPVGEPELRFQEDCYDFLKRGADCSETSSAGKHIKTNEGDISAGLDGIREEDGARYSALGSHGSYHQQESSQSDQVPSTSFTEDVFWNKERVKQTAEFRQADEAEWALRQQELERQAQETQRLRQRKRLEADKKLEMERKQRQRIEELRLSQMKEEKSMSLREQIRGQVQAELEQIAASCIDLASLLRRLGVPLEGGHHPTTQQVNAAYKRALFKFHPDRASTSAQGDPRQQVEAEEKFKLISRMKNTLSPVGIDDFHPYR